MNKILLKIQGIWFSFVFFLIKIRSSVFGGPKVEVSPSISSVPSLLDLPVLKFQASPIPQIMKGKVTHQVVIGTEDVVEVTWDDGVIEHYTESDPHLAQLLMAGAQNAEI